MAAKLCNVCNTRRVGTGSKGTETAPHGSDMCNYCYEEGSWENSHQDEGHNEPTIATPALTDGCWICHPKLNLAQQPKGASTGSRVQGIRRPQLNHKGHSHPQTPAARRECKKAFWTSIRDIPGTMSPEQVSKAMQAWDCKLDGNGKPVAPKSATWHVAPLGPKGGVGVSLKAAAAKASSK